MGLEVPVFGDYTPERVPLPKAMQRVERYAREWLEQQTVTGVLVVEAADADPQTRTYHLEVAVANPAMSVRSCSRHSAMCPGEWPGASRTSKPATSSPSRRPGTHARPCSALARRLPCVRIAPFGDPVVPLV